MRFFGIPLMRYIDMSDSEQVLKALEMTDSDMPIDFILHTPGGLVLPSLQIARAIDQHEGKVRVFVPHFSMSGGTLIALAADKIHISAHAVLGPVDPQVQQYPASSIKNAVNNKPLDQVDDETLILDNIAEKAQLQLRNSVQKLLRPGLDESKAHELADILTRGAWTHDYPLHHETLAEMGLPISSDIPDEIFELMSTYSQPFQKGSVEYLPFPHHKQEE